MMRKKFIIFFLYSITICSVMFVNSGIKTTAEECNDCNQISTEPGNADYSKMNCDCLGVLPTIIPSSDTIPAGGSITLHVDSGGLACPPYSWSVSGSGYSLNKSETENDLETVMLSCASGF